MAEAERKPLLEGKQNAAYTSEIHYADAENDIHETHVYKRRWYIVFLFMTVNIVQSQIWNTWGPIEESAKLVYGWRNWMVALQTNWGCISFLSSMVFFSWILETKGLRFGFVMTAFCVALGSAAKCITSYDPLATILINFCSFTSGLAAPVLSAAPPMLSAIWFPAEERVLSTSIAVFGNILGSGLPFIIGPLIVTEIPCLHNNKSVHLNHHFKHYGKYFINSADNANYTTNCTSDEINEQRNKIMEYNYIEAGIAVALFLMVVLYYPAKPPKPPSVTAQIQRVKFASGLKQCLRNKNLWLISIAYSLTFGISSVWCSLMTVIFEPIGVSEKTSGWIGFIAQMVGSFACVFFSRIANIFQGRMKLILFLLTAACLCFMVWLILMVEKVLPFRIEFLYVAAIAVVTFCDATGALYLEISCESGYPLPESVIGGMLTFTCNVICFVFLCIFFIPNISVIWFNYFLAGTIVITLPLILMFKAKYIRFNIDTDVNIQNGSNIQNG